MPGLPRHDDDLADRDPPEDHKRRVHSIGRWNIESERRCRFVPLGSASQGVADNGNTMKSKRPNECRVKGSYLLRCWATDRTRERRWRKPPRDGSTAYDLLPGLCEKAVEKRDAFTESPSAAGVSL